MKRAILISVQVFGGEFEWDCSVYEPESDKNIIWIEGDTRENVRALACQLAVAKGYTVFDSCDQLLGSPDATTEQN